MAHCFMLFIAGFENTISATNATLFELARNQDVQERLFQEISKFCIVDGALNITFDKVNSMEYLDMVLCGEKFLNIRATLPGLYNKILDPRGNLESA